jgi:hypothetical protein
MRSILALAGAAALASLASCMCTDAAETTHKPVAELSGAKLSVLYAPTSAGTFRADVAVVAGECTQVPDGAAADVGGVALAPQSEGEACFCQTSRFAVDGAATPAAADGAFRVTDGSAEMAAAVPDLFVAPAVALRAPATALRIGTRVYLDFPPANGTLTDVTVSFTPYDTWRAAFMLKSSDGTLGHDANGYYVDVPGAVGGEGELVATTRATLATSACVGAAECEVVATATRRLATAVIE